MKRTLLARMRNEDGSAMTEFVITLPIFIMIFAGMGMLYRFNNEGMVARMKTNQLLVADATAPNTVAGMVPGVGGTISISGFGDLVANGSGALGMYFDSYVKAGLAEAIIPGTIIKNPADPPVNNIEDITLMSGLQASESFTNAQLNDMAHPHWDGSGWANIIFSIVGTFGVVPAGVAGIRYQPIQRQTGHSFTTLKWDGGADYDPGMLQLASPTAAHHRAVAVAASRIAANTKAPYKECILEFTIDLCTAAAGGSTPAAETMNEQLQACADQSTIWQTCMDDCENPLVEPNPTTGVFGCDCDCQCNGVRPPEDCGDISGDAGGIDVDSTPCPPGYCGSIPDP